MQYRLLGALEVTDEGRTLDLGALRQRALLAILLINRGNTLTTERLAQELWGEEAPANAAKAVQVYVSRLRKILGAQSVLTRGRGYELAPDSAVDVDHFQSLIDAGRALLAGGDARAATQRLREALELWRGPALADFTYETFAQAEIERLEGLRLDATEDRLEAELQLGRTRELIGELEALNLSHPNRERFLSQLMLALYRCGRQQDALAAYRRGAESLRERLALEPTSELRELERLILNQDESLELPRTGAWPVPRGMRRRHRLAVATASVLLAGTLALGAFLLASGGGPAQAAAANSLVAIGLHDDRVIATVTVGADPDGVALGDGSVWVSNLGDGTVSRVDPATMRTLRTLPLAARPDGIASADGRIWVAESSAGSSSVSVQRIDAGFDAIEKTVEIPNVVAGSPVAIAARQGSLWVAPFSGELTALDPASGRVLRRLDPNAAPVAVAPAQGSVWVSDNEADVVTDVALHGEPTAISVGHSPDAIAVGAGAVWVADTGDGVLERIDPATRAVVARIAAGQAPSAVAVGGGSVWVADAGAGTVLRIDPSDDRVVAKIHVGASPRAITIGDGRVWVTLSAPALPAREHTRQDGTARLVSSYDVSSMDPALADDPLSWQLLYATCAKLLNYPDSSGPAASRLVPEAAQALPRISHGGRTYSFAIRPGLRFSPPSNEAVTARTFKDVLERDLDPRMRSPLAGEYMDIAGARAYMEGRAAHLAGVSAAGDRLTIRLREPSPDLLARLAEPAGCAVPADTPANPDGVEVIPSAGPYRVSARTPGQGLVLSRNPNYHGRRPHSLARIDVSVDVPGSRAVAEVESGRADYAVNGEVNSSEESLLQERFGAHSAAARAGHQQFFVNAFPNLDLLALNSHRPLFADVRLRRAVSYALDRPALARIGSEASTFPETPIDHYLPPGMPGYRDVNAYPPAPDLARARKLAAGFRGRTVVLYTCDAPTCGRRARLIAAELAAIGLRLRVRRFPDATLYTKLATPGEPFDMASVEWAPSYVDPDALMNFLIESGQVIPSLADPQVAARLSAAARLSGPARYLTYGRLDQQVARTAAPLVAYGVSSAHELFSARMGCERYGVYGYDIAALCIRR